LHPGVSGWSANERKRSVTLAQMKAQSTGKLWYFWLY
jgi:hypothetical protein